MPLVSSVQAATTGVVVRGLSGESGGAEIVEGLRGGEPWARRALFDRYAPYVARILGRVLGRDAELEDVLHDTFVQAYTSADRIHDPGALEGWLATVAIFTARGVIRRRRVRRWLTFSAPEELPEQEAPVSEPASRQALCRFYAVLDTLPPDDGIAFALRVVDGMDLTEVALRCGCSLATVKRRIARAEKAFLEAARDDPVLRQHVEEGRWASQ